MMIKFFERLFCKHKYKIDVVKHKYTRNDGNSEEAHTHTYFLECTECGRRKVVLSEWVTYPSQAKELFRLWKRREIEIGFNDATNNKKGEEDWTEEQLDL
jgi:hypothetical protein